MRLVELDEGLLDVISTIGDKIRFGKAGARSKMDIAKANPPKDNKTNRNKKSTYKNICGKWDDPKTTGCVKQ